MNTVDSIIESRPVYFRKVEISNNNNIKIVIRQFI